MPFSQLAPFNNKDCVLELEVCSMEVKSLLEIQSPLERESRRGCQRFALLARVLRPYVVATLKEPNGPCIDSQEKVPYFMEPQSSMVKIE